MKKFAGVDLESILGATEVELRDIEEKFLGASTIQLDRCGIKMASSTEALCENINNFYSLNHCRLYCMYKTADIPLNKKQVQTFWDLILKHQSDKKYRPVENTPNWQTVMPAYKACINQNFLEIDLQLAVISKIIRQGLQDHTPEHVYAFAIANYIKILNELNKYDSKYLSPYAKKVNNLLANCVLELQAIPVASEKQGLAKTPLLHVFAIEKSDAPSAGKTFTIPRLTAFLS